jgi:enoyl-CoA hydratase/carnithine racemase
MTYQTIRYESIEHVGTLTLARPEKLNAQNPLMWQELTDLGQVLRDDEDLRCLIVAGEGTSFSSGIDLVEGLVGMIGEARNETKEISDAQTIETGLRLAGVFAWIPNLHCPSVAAVKGHAYGAGLQLALSCDFRVLARDAKVGLVETRFGLLPDMGATIRLPRIVGEHRAREMILLGQIIDADEAYRIGLASRVVDGGDVEREAAKLAAMIAEKPPLAIRGARRALEAAWYNDPDTSFRVAIRAQIECLRSSDFQEGLAAMAEARQPHWLGR